MMEHRDLMLLAQFVALMQDSDILTVFNGHNDDLADDDCESKWLNFQRALCTVREALGVHA